MTARVKALVEFHETITFGNGENLRRQQKKARSGYAALTRSEVTELAEESIAQIEKGNSRFETALCCLACFRPGSLGAIHQPLVKRRVLYPGVIFHGAGSEIAEQIIDVCEREDCHDHALVALAWIGDKTVQTAFARWRKKPPAWKGKLFVPPHRYAEEAGWELTDKGERRDLFHQVAYPLVRPKAASGVNKSVKIGVPVEQACRWCKRDLVGLFDLSAIEGVLPNQGVGPVRIVTCQACGCVSTLFMKYGSGGEAKWHSKNKKPSYLQTDAEWDAFPESPLVMTRQTRHFMEAANWSMLPGVAFSQVGGLPTWIQDAEYPACPDCSQKMPFVGQISNEDFMEYGEGIYYAFRCPPCNVTATCYQQT